MRQIFFFIFFSVSMVLNAQKNVSGTITDPKGAVLSNVRVIVLDTEIETKSDHEGKYSVVVPDGFHVLKFIHNGFQDFELVIISEKHDVTMQIMENNPSIEDLMILNLSIVTKKEESNFQTPLSSSVITIEEIINSGATSIPEALRLIPGFIVREQTNGVYDAHIRGFDYNINSVLSYANNSITLVMIDGRPIFRDFQGGTFWESLPIGLTDVYRIEVIRGASSSVYGANAVAGVINIVTKRIKDNDKENEYLNANIQKGNFGTSIISLNTGIRKKKWNIGLSGNTQQRDRFDVNYYDVHRNAFVPLDSLLNRFGTSYALAKTKNTRYPNPRQSNNFFGVNSYVTYRMNPDVKLDLCFGLQKSQVQKAYVDIGYTPFTTEISETGYANLRAKIYNIYMQASHLSGYQNSFITGGWEYTFNNNDFDIDYNLNLLDDRIDLNFGYNFRSTLYSDSVYTKSNGAGTGFINTDNALLYTNAAYARFDYRINQKFRIFSSLRADKYNYPDVINFSYQVASTFKPNDKNLFRVVISKANKGPVILDNYFNYNWMNTYIYLNNQNLDLTTINHYEVGCRSAWFKNLSIDAEIFHQVGNNFTISSFRDSVTPGPLPAGTTTYYSPRNLSIKPSQTGITISLIYHPTSRFQLKPFGTWQKTVIPDENLKINPYDSVRYSSDWTPEFYYGAYLDYAATQKINFNATIYGFSQIYFHDRDYAITDVIKDKVLLTLRTSYMISKGLSLYLNIRNLNMVSLVNWNKLKPNSDNQFGYTDNIKPLILFGLNIDM